MREANEAKYKADQEALELAKAEKENKKNKRLLELKAQRRIDQQMIEWEAKKAHQKKLDDEAEERRQREEAAEWVYSKYVCGLFVSTDWIESQNVVLDEMWLEYIENTFDLHFIECMTNGQSQWSIMSYQRPDFVDI